MSFDKNAYNKKWMAEQRVRQHKDYLISRGKCPYSEILLTSAFHEAHCPCGLHPNIDRMKQETLLRIKMLRGEYIPILVKEDMEVSFQEYFIIREGYSIELKFM